MHSLTLMILDSGQTPATEGDGTLSLAPEVVLLDVIDPSTSPGASPVLTAIIRAAETRAVPAVATVSGVAHVPRAPAVQGIATRTARARYAFD